LKAIWEKEDLINGRAGTRSTPRRNGANYALTRKGEFNYKDDQKFTAVSTQTLGKSSSSFYSVETKSSRVETGRPIEGKALKRKKKQRKGGLEKTFFPSTKMTKQGASDQHSGQKKKLARTSLESSKKILSTGA